MNMGDLNNTQLVLLVLFVSFITSIATGIVTVSLLSEAPLPVTQTINRVVERTVERVVPGRTTTTLVREVPTVISDDDFLNKTIAAAFPAIVKIIDDSASKTTNGFLISADGVIITTAAAIEDRSVPYFAVFPDKERRPASVLAVNTAADFAVLKLGGAKEGERFPFIALEGKQISLGQKVVASGADGHDSIALGVITELKTAVASGTPTVHLSFSDGKPSLGSPVLTIRGGLVGMWKGDGELVFFSRLAEAITAALATATE